MCNKEEPDNKSNLSIDTIQPKAVQIIINDKITVVPSAQVAIYKYLNLMVDSVPYTDEWLNYASIVGQLYCGLTVCNSSVRYTRNKTEPNFSSVTIKNMYE